ncbi:hypothetical protein [Conexibacter woesei]|uniref:Uncharacterized protein n=1 Tax=Conexibacter woesei (strain DSM 14684 / CCUG 47730 / CIP 108061 / JCM 11494 / NBRC 100937 / ID131577) TaxID=469383 RepID=D3FBR3_CONWI|nr:hypothetical protein [Conexibacter woesei]ADB51328.1 hypothetical protein Cwoe_2909 [Conexibacter woesei DSM 14684]
MPAPRNVHHATTRLLSAIMLVIGVVLLVRTLAEGGGPLSVGVIMGVLFVAAGAGRIALSRRQQG